MKFLGMHLDQSLAMHDHIMKKCQVASLYLTKMRKFRKFLTMDICRTMVQVIVISHLDFSNSLFYALPWCELSRMQHIQNLAAKTILNRCKLYDNRESVEELH